MTTAKVPLAIYLVNNLINYYTLEVPPSVTIGVKILRRLLLTFYMLVSVRLEHI